MWSSIARLGCMTLRRLLGRAASATPTSKRAASKITFAATTPPRYRLLCLPADISAFSRTSGCCGLANGEISRCQIMHVAAAAELAARWAEEVAMV